MSVMSYSFIFAVFFSEIPLGRRRTANPTSVPESILYSNTQPYSARPGAMSGWVPGPHPTILTVRPSDCQTNQST